MCKALTLWHKKGAVHNRVKPSAIYKDSISGYCLGEPDIHYMLDKSISYSNMIYQRYIVFPMIYSLEVLSKEPPKFSADIWSLGVVTYEMMNQTTPFKAKDVASMKRAII